MGGLIKNNGEITSNDEYKEVTYNKVLHIKSSTPDVDVKGFINKLMQFTNLGEVISTMKEGTEFIVEIPTEFQRGFDSGEFWIMENSKTGKMWPNLMKVGESGKNEIITPLAVKKHEFMQGNPARELANNYHNIYMKEQMNELILRVEDTYKKVELIEHGQMDDRIALLESGRQGIILALSQKDESTRKQAMLLAVNNINVAQNQIYETLRRRVSVFEPLPECSILQFLKEYMRNGYLDSKDKEYDEIIEYYGFYLDATKMLAATYAITGDLDSSKKIFELAEDKMKKVNFSNLKTIEYAHKKGNIEKIYENSINYLSVEEKICLENAKEYDCVSIKFTKQDLLEVFEDGREQ